MNNNNIMVSVCCLVYNHEKYLRKCLDGFVMQRTNFKFEVLIHDDASTDHSADIIREYEKKYSDIIKPIYQKENQYSKKVKINWVYQYPRIKGKYVAWCEGDDYWCDPNKLQKQFDIMEKYDDVALCTHKVKLIKENGDDTNLFIPRHHLDGGRYNTEEVLSLFIDYNKYPFHTSSYFTRYEYLAAIKNKFPRFMEVSPAGDSALVRYLALQGNVLYIDNEYSCYRIGVKGGWNSMNMQNRENIISTYKREMASYLLYDVYSDGKYSDLINQIIEMDVFLINQLNKNYKNIVSKRFRNQFCRLPLKEKIYSYIAAYMPWLEKAYRRLKSHE